MIIIEDHILVPIIISIISSAIITASLTTIIVKKRLGGKTSTDKDNVPQPTTADIKYSIMNDLKTEIANKTDISQIETSVDDLKQDQTEFKTTITNTITDFRKDNNDVLHTSIDEIYANKKTELVQYIDEQLSQKGFNKQEIARINERIDGFLGKDNTPKQLALMSKIIGSDRIQTVKWKCNMLELLEDGLSLEGNDLFRIKSNIGIKSAQDFIKKLDLMGILTTKEIIQYNIKPEYDWITQYTDEPHTLKNKLDIRYESDYEQYIRNNLHLVENGLQLSQSQKNISDSGGFIDLMCVDMQGRYTGLELKYPVAPTKINRQINEYRDAYTQDNEISKESSRFIIVAPSIPEIAKTRLVEAGFEWCEVKMPSAVALES